MPRNYIIYIYTHTHTVFKCMTEFTSSTPFGQTWATSFLIRACHSGCKASSNKHQEAATEVVSCPAKYMFLQLSTMNRLDESFPRLWSLMAASIIICNRSFSDEHDSKHSCSRSFTTFQINDSISLSKLLISLCFPIWRNLPLHC